MATRKDEWDAFVEKVQPGDKLISTPNWGVGVVVQVERITTVLLVCRTLSGAEYRVRKADGYVTGERGYTRTLFKPATPERLAAHRVAQVKEWCRHHANVELAKLTPTQQEAVYQLVKSFKKEESEA